MEFLIVLAVVIGLVIAYFCIGITLNFIWGWWIMILATPMSIYIAVTRGWSGAVGGMFLFFGAVGVTNYWQGTELYTTVSVKLDETFSLNDT